MLGLWWGWRDNLQNRIWEWVHHPAGGSWCRGWCGWVQNWGRGEMWGWNIWICNQHQVLQMAKVNIFSFFENDSYLYYILGKSAMSQRKMLRSIHLRLNVKRFQLNCVDQQDVDLNLVLRSVMTKLPLLSGTIQKKHVHWIHRELASMSPNLFLLWRRWRTVLMFQRRSVLDLKWTQGRWRFQLSRSGAM